jgi:hypothetical protein
MVGLRFSTSVGVAGLLVGGAATGLPIDRYLDAKFRRLLPIPNDEGQPAVAVAAAEPARPDAQQSGRQEVRDLSDEVKADAQRRVEG